MAGVIKTALALERRYIPGTAHFRAPNPEMDLPATPLRVSADGEPWPDAGHPARAGVSSFGIGGTNAHVVLEEAPPRPATSPRRDLHILTLSARCPEALDAARTALAEHLRGPGEPAIADVAHTLQSGRSAFPHRRTVVCGGLEEAAAALGADARTRTAHAPGAAPVAFMFPGQASQHAGMGARLYRAERVFRAAMDECAELFAGELGWDVRGVAFARDAERLTQTLYTQPAVFSVDYALARQLMAWGVRPAAMIGHSLGEIVAACLAGVLTLPGAVRLVATRARLMQELPPGRMLAVALDEARLRDLLAETAGEVAIAAVNAPRACVVSGPAGAVEELRESLDKRGVSVRELATSHAFHSPMMEPALAGVVEAVSAETLGEPRVPFVSNVSGTWITAGQATDPAYWAAQIREPVRFADGVAALLERGCTLLAEVGPGRVLSRLARGSAQGGAPVVATLPAPAGASTVAMLPAPAGEGADEERALLEGLAALWRHGAAIDWPAFQEEERPHRVPLPGYRFQRRRHLLPRVDAATVAEARRDPARWTYAPVWHRSAVPVPETGDGPGRWLVFEDRDGLAARLTAELRHRGHTVTTIGPAPKPGEVTRLVRGLRQENRLPARVVHAACVSGPTGRGDLVGGQDRHPAPGHHLGAVDLGDVRLDAAGGALPAEGGDRPGVGEEVVGAAAA
ncbi:type I polyketide synthase [Nonomuraea sp. NPDC055795]